MGVSRGCSAGLFPGLLTEASKEKDKSSESEVISAQQAEGLKMKEKIKRESERKLPRKKRRRLEAAREMLEDGDEADNPEEVNKKGKKDKSGIPLLDIGYRRAKAIKAGKRAQEAGRNLERKEKFSI
ncbi:hypothetical protein Dimus_018097 [Dionaea muscipula]